MKPLNYTAYPIEFWGAHFEVSGQYYHAEPGDNFNPPEAAFFISDRITLKDSSVDILKYVSSRFEDALESELATRITRDLANPN
jgi:hypothetical protein